MCSIRDTYMDHRVVVTDYFHRVMMNAISYRCLYDDGGDVVLIKYV